MGASPVLYAKISSYPTTDISRLGFKPVCFNPSGELFVQQSLFSLFTPETTASAAPMVNTLPGELALDQRVLTVLDIETTGLHPKRNDITEITAIQYRWHQATQTAEELGMLTTLVKPADVITDEVIRITGITADMVADAPAPRQVLQHLLDLLGNNPVIVGHNIAFDINFIREKLLQNGLPASTVTLERGVCTRNLARKLVPGLPGYEGVVVAHACDVINDNPHRAEADVRMSAGILFYLLSHQLSGKVATVGDVQAIQGPLKG
jgi:DNA polymerase III epsilon subunit-like protein